MQHAAEEMAHKVQEFTSHVEKLPDPSGVITAINQQDLTMWEPGMLVNAAYAAAVANNAGQDPSRAFKLGLTTNSSGIIGQLIHEQRSMVGGSPPQTGLQPQSPGDALFSGDFVTNAWERSGGTIADLERLTSAVENFNHRQTTATPTPASQVGGFSSGFRISGVSY